MSPGSATETARLAELASYHLLNGDPEPVLARALRLALRLCRAPAGLISFVDGEKAWLKARIGIEADALPADGCVSGMTVRLGHPIFVADTHADPRLAGYEHLRGRDGARFCGSVPLVSPRGHAIGALCVLDAQVRPDLGLTEQAALEDLAQLIMAGLEERRQSIENQALARRAALMRQLMEVASDTADLQAAVQAAAEALNAATSGILCHLWRRLPGDPPRAQFLAGANPPGRDGAELLAAFRNQVLDNLSAPTLRCMIEGRQVAIEDITDGGWPVNPLMQAVADRGVRTLLASPFTLGEESFALVLGLGARRQDLPGLKATMLDAAAALRPIMRRIRNDEHARLLRRVVEATSDAVLITEAEPVDQPGPRIVYANPAFEQETGYTEAEVLGKTPRLLQGPGTSDVARANISAALHAWRPVRQELLNYRKDGTSFWSDLQISPVADSTGWYTHWVSFQRNITRDREASIALAAAIAERDALIEHMPGTLLRIRRGPDGGRWVMTAVMPTLEQLTGHTPAEAMAPGWFEAHADAADRASSGFDADRIAREGRASREFRFLHKTGKWLWIRSLTRAHTAADGGQEVVSIWSDVTVEKILAEQLAHSAKLAQLGELTTGMAHELNQPLASISLAAENAIRRLESPQHGPGAVRKKLEMIVDQTGRVARLIDHMRVFGRTENLPTGPVPLRGVVEDALAILAHKLKFAGVEVRFEAPSDLPPVLGSAIPLEQVLINLISNACDAYGEHVAGSAPDRVVAIEARRSGGRVLVAVRDRAGGIPPDILPRIFEPFFTTKAASYGTGLGLSISYGIVNDMGGTLRAGNSADGAVFTLDLPAA
jgi:PAS domain S-box-containing protein